MENQGPDRAIRVEVIVDAPPHEVWLAWTTEDGVRSFFAPACNVDLRVDGPYEIFFNPEGEPGHRGAEGMRVMAYQEDKMLAFTWNAPIHLPTVRNQLTHVQVWLEAMGDASECVSQTRVTLLHRGWGEGGEWDEAFAYFTRAWGKVVMPRLKERFEHGPVDWEEQPK